MNFLPRLVIVMIYGRRDPPRRDACDPPLGKFLGLKRPPLFPSSPSTPAGIGHPNASCDYRRCRPAPDMSLKATATGATKTSQATGVTEPGNSINGEANKAKAWTPKVISLPFSTCSPRDSIPSFTFRIHLPRLLPRFKGRSKTSLVFRQENEWDEFLAGILCFWL